MVERKVWGLNLLSFLDASSSGIIGLPSQRSEVAEGNFRWRCRCHGSRLTASLGIRALQDRSLVLQLSRLRNENYRVLYPLDAVWRKASASRRRVRRLACPPHHHHVTDSGTREALVGSQTRPHTGDVRLKNHGFILQTLALAADPESRRGAAVASL